jgi:heme-degrading monooxygenase HmoA
MLFEYWLKEEHVEEYTRQSNLLRRLVLDIDGFVSIERFRSEKDPTKILVIGYFKDEEAVQAWRNLPQHRAAQSLGRDVFFSDYQLCMAEVIRDYSMSNRQQVPSDSLRFQIHNVEQWQKRGTHMIDVAIQLSNHPGSLADMGETLGRAGISIEGGGAWVVDGIGIAHFLFEDGDAARRVL